ncbi:phosphoenolpyruvate synthase, partial [Candidatus Shapirobacteria bacterium]|nr:phosphoenolpyruvate synthase [Candidatus Shapirobacteria bacterium]
MKNKASLLWFKDIHFDDVNIVGGKGANLGEMYNLGIPVPNGFCVTAEAYFKFIEANKLKPKIKAILDIMDVDDPEQLSSSSAKIRKLIKDSPLPPDIALEIMTAYKKLCGFAGLKNVPVAVRTSATAEDSADASFAGQGDTFLNVIGESNVVAKVRACWSSLFTSRSIFYQRKKHYDHFKIGVAVPVQKMVQSEISGIAFTLNPVTNNKNEIVVETIWGLGEYIVQGIVTPDQYLIDKGNWDIKYQNHVTQTVQLTRFEDGNKKLSVPKYKQNKSKITDSMAIKIAKLSQKLHNHYGKAQDIEFAIEKNKLYFVQTRPITTVNVSQKNINSQTKIDSNLAPLLSGEPASPGSGSGIAIVINNPKDIYQVQKGQILVTEMTTPDFVPAMKKVNGIVTDKGGQTSHAAIVSRELGVPCVVGTNEATKLIKDGDIITVDG